MRPRSPPPPPSSQESEDTRHSGPSQDASRAGGPIGAFWSTQHGKDSAVIDNKRSFFNEPVKQAVSKQNHNTVISKDNPPRESHAHPRQPGRIEQGNPADGNFKIKFSQEMKHCSQRPKVLYPEDRSQRQEIQELKGALSALSPSPPSKDRSKSHNHPGSLDSAALPRDKIEGSVWDLQQGMMLNPSAASHRPELKTWNAFHGEPKIQAAPRSTHPISSGARATKKTESEQPAGWAGF
ncbi:hypothetical protein BHM03_00028863 [Ensete ventricosum]|nr:hypothetical protein BHM03_00028863 [Ensete ventricosum]